MTEEQKLVAFFRSREGSRLGNQGDHDNLTPAETAIRAMKELVTLTQECNMCKNHLFRTGVL